MSNREKTNQQARQARRRNAFLYGAAGVMLAIAALLVVARGGDAHQHPKPRAEAEQMKTEHPDRFGAYPEAKEVYQLAAHIKSTLDGLFCYCYCEGGGHYSLLDCFKDDHGAGCDVCLGEARVAYDMIQQGKTLDEIRAVIDAQFGNS